VLIVAIRSSPPRGCLPSAAFSAGPRGSWRPAGYAARRLFREQEIPGRGGGRETPKRRVGAADEGGP
jgi:hypothetical protein